MDDQSLQAASVEELLERGFQAFDANVLEDAERIYRAVLKRPLAALQRRQGQHMLAFVLGHQGQFEEARMLYNDLLIDAQTRDEPRAVSVAMHQLGMTERLAQDYPAAMRWFDTEHEYLQVHLPTSDAALSANAYERGFLQLLTHRADQAETILQQALTYANRAQNAMCTACALRGLGSVAQERGNLTEARDYFQRSADAFRTAGDGYGAAEVEAQMAAL